MVKSIGKDRLEAERSVLVVSTPGSPLDSFAKNEGLRLPFGAERAHDESSAGLALASFAPCVAIVELHLPTPQLGLQLCRSLRARSRELCLMLLAPLASVEERIRALDVGVDDCVIEPFDPRELAALVNARLERCERRSGTYPTTSPAPTYYVHQRAEELATRFNLSPREAQLLVLIASGKHPKQCAAELRCGYESVRTHLRRMAKKLGCNGTRELIVRFFAA